jgi:hypothetical protein
MMKRYVYVLLALLGAFVLLQPGCVWRDDHYSSYPYSYDGYYGYPYGSYYYWGPYFYDGYYGYPYGSYYWRSYPSYRYRDYRYHYDYRGRDRDNDQRIRPRPPQGPPPKMNTSPLRPNRPKEEGPPLIERPYLRRYQPER